MKQKMRILGPRVHDVGYRYFLMSNAMSRGIRMFEAHNIEGGEEDEVMVLVDGGEKEIAALRKLVETRRPERAEVSKVAFEDYDSDVIRIGEYAQFCTTVQMNKAIPVLLDIRDDMKSMKDDMKSLAEGQDILIKGQNEIVIEIRSMRENLIERSDDRLARMEKDTQAIKTTIGIC
jgi:acylphosphatase